MNQDYDNFKNYFRNLKCKNKIKYYCTFPSRGVFDHYVIGENQLKHNNTLTQLI